MRSNRTHGIQIIAATRPGPALASAAAQRVEVQPPRRDPETLGDDYAEIVESLNRLADAKLKLSIVPRAERGG